MLDMMNATHKQTGAENLKELKRLALKVSRAANRKHTTTHLSAAEVAGKMAEMAYHGMTVEEIKKAIVNGAENE